MHAQFIYVHIRVQEMTEMRVNESDRCIRTHKHTRIHAWKYMCARTQTYAESNAYTQTIPPVSSWYTKPLCLLDCVVNGTCPKIRMCARLRVCLYVIFTYNSLCKHAKCCILCFHSGIEIGSIAIGHVRFIFVFSFLYAFVFLLFVRLRFRFCYSLFEKKTKFDFA